MIAAGEQNVIVPPSSIADPADAGLRAHTNHLILAGSNSGGRAPGGGLTPEQVRGAYGASADGGSGAIAIVDAFNYPTALSDFNTFSSAFGLPGESSTDRTNGANQVFQVVYASASRPPDNADWAQEMALDIEWAHAVSPHAKIYLVEAASDTLNDLMSAVAVAKNLPGVRQVSMSFGAGESGCAYVQFNSAFLRNGVTFYAAAGDTPGERDFPALSYNVVAVGGTSLSVNATGVWLAEVVWPGTGCGKSAYEPRPIFQDVVYSKVGLYRAACDIAADGDPATGVAVYDSFPANGMSGWFVVGGTSVSTPIIAAIVNNTGATFANSQALNTKLYTGIGDPRFHDITSGSSGGFSATAGWDFPTGVGTPRDPAGFFAG